MLSTEIVSCPFSIKKGTSRILWEITSKCNLKCKHCLQYSKDFSLDENGRNELSLNAIKKIIREISEDKIVQEIWLSGGEPLMHKNIFEIINEINNFGIKVSLSTNGTLITYQTAKALYDAGIRYVHLSLDGACAYTHDSIRGMMGAFHKTLNALVLLHTYKIQTGVTFMVTNDSVNEIYKVIDLVKKYYVKTVSFYCIEPMGRGINYQEDREKLMKKMIEFEATCSHKYKDIKIEIFRAVDTKQGGFLKGCSADEFLTISSDGKLWGCPWYRKSKFQAFSVSLESMRFVEARKIIQKKMRVLKEGHKRNKKKCDSCLNNILCQKGCLALTDEEGYDNLCRYIFKGNNGNKNV